MLKTKQDLIGPVLGPQKKVWVGQQDTARKEFPSGAAELVAFDTRHELAENVVLKVPFPRPVPLFSCDALR